MPALVNLFKLTTRDGRPCNTTEALIIVKAVMKPYSAPAFADEIVSELGRDRTAPHLASHIASRLMQFTPGMRFDYETVRLCGDLSDRIATSMMWAYTLAYFQRYKSTSAIPFVCTPTDWCKEMVFGVPTDEYLQTAWFAQKKVGAPNTNLLDDPNMWTPEAMKG